MTTFLVTHRTRYRYAEEVVASYGQATLLPRSLPHQQVHDASLAIEPAPEDARERVDFHGNRSVHFTIHDPHRRLVVTARSRVEVAAPGPADLDVPAGRVAWEQVRDRVASATDPMGLDARMFVLDSPLVPASPRLAAWAAPSFPPGRPVVAAVVDLASRIHADFEFESGATTVTSTIDDLLDGGKGVCQDFAHLMIGSLRSRGLPARYVSGYIETRPPPGRPKRRGSDVSHAWVSAWIPDLGWIHLDPTNDKRVDDGYVTTAWGRDYGDITPLKGIIFTDGTTEELTVEVDVERV